jgi:predicted ATP-grasp superfamily ATP-dependent carboligase
VRSLGRRGVPVHVIVDGDDRLAAHSRYAREISTWPDSDEERVEHLEAIARRSSDPLALFPSADETAALVSRNHETLSRLYALTTPPWDVFRWTYDKRLTYELGERAGVKCPQTLYPRDRADLEQANLTFPVVIKPATKPQFNRLVAAKAWRVDDRDELLRRYDEAAGLADPATLMIQQLIPGDDGANLSYAALAESGRVLHHIVARRTRQYPPDFGRASTFVESIDDPGIGEPAMRVIEACRFTGLIEVEFKIDARSGEPFLLDMNPRVWGWHTLGRRAGVDFPWLQWLRLREEETPDTQPQPGVRWLRISTDLPTAAKEIIKGRQSFREYVSSLMPPHEGAIIARDDPRPGLVEMPLLGKTLIKRLAAGEGV